MLVYKKRETIIDLTDFLDEILDNYEASRQERLNPRLFVTHYFYDLISDCIDVLYSYGYDIISEDSVENELYTSSALKYIKNYFNNKNQKKPLVNFDSFKDNEEEDEDINKFIDSLC